MNIFLFAFYLRICFIVQKYAIIPKGEKLFATFPLLPILF